MLPQKPQGPRTNHEADQTADNAEPFPYRNAAERVKAKNEYTPADPKTNNRDHPAGNPLSSFLEWWGDPYRDKPRWTDIAIVVLTGGIIFLGYMQWQEMHSGGIDTRNLATAAQFQAQQMETIAQVSRAQASAALTQANQAEIQARASLQQVGKLEAGVRETHALAEQAQRSANIAQETLQIEERPWVGVIDLSVSDDIAIGKVPSAKMRIQNGGRTPAIHVEVLVRMNTYCGEFPKRPEYDPVGPGSKTILMPGLPQDTAESKFTAPINEAFMQQFANDSCNLYAFGRITYDDTLQNHHWRHVCTIWQKGTPRTFTICSVYTDGDEDYKDGKEPD